MRRWGVTAAALVAVLLGVHPGMAATDRGPSKPTLSVATYVGSTRLPHALLSGGWTKASPRAAALRLEGTTVTGTTTRVAATWTSAWGWAMPDRPALQLRVGAEHMSLLPGVEPSTWGWAVYARTTKHGKWHLIPPSWTVEQAYDPQFVIAMGFTTEDRSTQKVRAQFQVRLRASIDATYDEKLTFDSRLLTRP
jgi:hypothetical protein